MQQLYDAIMHTNDLARRIELLHQSVRRRQNFEDNRNAARSLGLESHGVANFEEATLLGCRSVVDDYGPSASRLAMLY
jgi:hypothetical protein